MKNLVRIFTGVIVTLCLTVTLHAQTTIQGQSPPFTFDTTSPVPLSWVALGIAALLIVGFVIHHHLAIRKKADV